MNKLIKNADKLYEEKNYEEARKGYINIIDNYLYEVPVGVILKLAISQRLLNHYDSSEKTLELGVEKFPKVAGVWREKAALENRRKNWEQAIEFWRKGYSLNKRFSLLSFQRYAIALQEYCKSRGENIDDKINENTCMELKALIESAVSTYGDDKKLKSILNSIPKKK